MRIYLLAKKRNMVKMWNKYFFGIEDVEIAYGDFSEFMNNHKVECVVSPANSFGLMDGGYDLAIIKWFGCELKKKVQNYIIENFCGEQPVATSFLIDTGHRDIKLIHTPTMREPESIKEPLVVYQCMRTTLLEAIKYKVNSIVIPAFGSECGNLEYDLIAKMMYRGYSQVMSYVPDEIEWDNHLSTRALYDNVASRAVNVEHCFEKNPYFSIVVGDILDDDIISKGDAIVLPDNLKMGYGTIRNCVNILKKDAMNKNSVSCEENNSENEETEENQGFDNLLDIIWICNPQLIEYPDDKYHYVEQLLLENYKHMLRFAYEQGYGSILLSSAVVDYFGFKHEFVGAKIVNVINEFMFDVEEELGCEDVFRVILVLEAECNQDYYRIITNN